MRDGVTTDIPAATWQAYRQSLLRFIQTRVSDAAAAEDIVQVVLAKAYAQRETLKDSARLRPWLYRITRHAIIDHYRRQRPTEALSPDVDLPDEAEEESGDQAAAQRELSACLLPLLETLPPHYRQAVDLTDLQGHTQQEAATAMGLSLSGAKSRVQRGRRLLKEKLLACCQIERDSAGRVVDYTCRSDDCGCPRSTHTSVPRP